MTDNVYSPPKAEVSDHVGGDRAAAIAMREEYLGHEASLRGMALLFYLSGIFILFMGIAVVLPVFVEGGDSLPIGIGIALLFVLLGVGSIYVGYGIRQLRKGVVVPACILSAIGMLNIPVGTLLNGYMLYLLLSAKGKVVFSERYAEVRGLTPEIRPRTSIVVWVVLGLLVLVILGAVIGAMG